MRKGWLIALGAVLIVVGAVFTLQGLGYLAGSPMTGVTTWAIIGPVIVVGGLALVGWAVRAGRTG